MKKMLVTAFLVVGLLIGISPASADLLNPPLGLPDILSNQTGSYIYADGLITFEAKPLTITFDGVDLTNIDPDSSGDRFYRAAFNVDSAGNFVNGVDGDDLVIQGAFGAFDGTLLTGEVTDFGYFDVPGPIALFDYTFEATGGLLADSFAAGGGDHVIAEFSTFVDSWEEPHSGERVKHDTSPVPIGSTLALFASGLGGLMVIRRRFRE